MEVRKCREIGGTLQDAPTTSVAFPVAYVEPVSLLLLYLFAYVHIAYRLNVKCFLFTNLQWAVGVSLTMRQLKGKVKETSKQKKERKKEFVENKRKLFTIAFPSIVAIFLLIATYVYLKTRPKSIPEY